MTNKELRRQSWIMRIAAYKQSGETMRVWCDKEGVTLDQLKYWLKKLKSQTGESGSSTPAAFVPLVCRETQPAPTSAALRLQVGVVQIEVNAGFDPKLLGDVVAALKPSC